MGVAVAGYPEGHPQSLTLREDRHHAQLKMDAGASFMITQLFFDVRPYLEMVERMRALGMRKPILPGIMPILSLASLRRVLSLCDAKIPGNLYLRLEEAHQRGGSQAVREVGSAFAAEQIRRLRDHGAPGIHIYTLNQAEVCLEIAERVGRL
jgi:methylenetetrahydrofolate reductase (NADPH)